MRNRARLLLAALVLLAGCKPQSSKPSGDEVVANFNCPVCGKPELGIAQRLELPPDGYSDELTLQTIQCNACALRGVAAYEESRRGASESFHHYGAQISGDDFAKVTADLRRCPTPGDRNCGCDIHQKYYDLENDSWRGLAMFTLLSDRFAMKLKD